MMFFFVPSAILVITTLTCTSQNSSSVIDEGHIGWEASSSSFSLLAPAKREPEPRVDRAEAYNRERTKTHGHRDFQCE